MDLISWAFWVATVGIIYSLFIPSELFHPHAVCGDVDAMARWAPFGFSLGYPPSAVCQRQNGTLLRLGVFPNSRFSLKGYC